MTTKRRMDYRVDEDALKRMMAGDVTALEETVPPAGALEKEAVPFRETQDKKASVSPSKKQTRKFPDEVTGTNEYRLRFLEAKLAGTRRQTYVNDTLYRTVAKV